MASNSLIKSLRKKEGKRSWKKEMTGNRMKERRKSLHFCFEDGRGHTAKTLVGSQS